MVAKNSKSGKAIATRPASGSQLAEMFPSGGPLTPIAGGGSGGSYVQFMHPQAKNYSAVVSAVGKLGASEPVLVDGNKYRKLSPFQFLAPPKYIQYYAETDTEYNVLNAASVEDNPRAPEGMKQYVDAVILVVAGKDIIPTRIRCMGPKCAGYRTASEIVRDISENPAEWFERGKDSKALALLGVPPWALVTFTGTMRTEAPRDVSRGQKPYELLDVTQNFTPVTVARQLMQLAGDEEFSRLLQSAKDSIEAREKEIQAKMS